MYFNHLSWVHRLIRLCSILVCLRPVTKGNQRQSNHSRYTCLRPSQNYGEQIGIRDSFSRYIGVIDSETA